MAKTRNWHWGLWKFWNVLHFHFNGFEAHRSMEPFFFILVAPVSLWSITLIKLFCLVPIKQVLFVWYPQNVCTGFCFTLETLITHNCISRVSDKTSYFISQFINGAVRFWLPLCTYNKRFYQWFSLFCPKGIAVPSQDSWLEMATHSSILWRIPWTEEPGRL